MVHLCFPNTQIIFNYMYIRDVRGEVRRPLALLHLTNEPMALGGRWLHQLLAFTRSPR